MGLRGCRDSYRDLKERKRKEEYDGPREGSNRGESSYVGS